MNRRKRGVLEAHAVGQAVQHLDGTGGETVRLVVTNAGAIPPAMFDRLFDPFSTSQQEEGRKGGLGLGLYIVQQVIAAHHGRVVAESVQDSTSFRAELPRDAREAVAH